MAIRITIKGVQVDNDRLWVAVESINDDSPGATLRWQQSFALNDTQAAMKTSLNTAATKLWQGQQLSSWTV